MQGGPQCGGGVTTVEAGHRDPGGENVGRAGGGREVFDGERVETAETLGPGGQVLRLVRGRSDAPDRGRGQGGQHPGGPTVGLGRNRRVHGDDERVGQAPAALGQVGRFVGRRHQVARRDAAAMTGLRGHDDGLEVDAFAIGQRGGALEGAVEIADHDQQAARSIRRQRGVGQVLERRGQRDLDVGLRVLRRAERFEAGQHGVLGQQPVGQAERGQAGLDR